MEEPIKEMTPDESIKTTLARLDERLKAHFDLSTEKWKNFEERTENFYTKVLEHEDQLIALNKWQSHIGGIWKATLFIATAGGFLLGIFVQVIK